MVGEPNFSTTKITTLTFVVGVSKLML